MNMTMPYRPFHSQSRVEFIKKKFESSLSEENSVGSLKQTNTVASCESNFFEERKNLNSVLHSITKAGFETDDINKYEGKASVKRSQAFRREKLNCSKSDTQISVSRTLIKFEPESLNKNAQKKTFKVEFCEVNAWNDFKRSKTDTNLQKYFTDKSADKGFFTRNSKNSNLHNPLGLNEIIDNKDDADEKISTQYSVINKERSDSDKNEAVTLMFSESIRKALQSPLPKGPPPKKPPRTFNHISHFTKSNPLTESSNALSAAIKTDIPILKSKLEKLEKVIRIHDIGSYKNKLKDDVDKKVNEISGKVESCSMPNVSDVCRSYLPISACQNFKKLSKTKSEFYLEMGKTDLKSSGFGKKKEYFAGSTSDEVSVKTSSSEAIYDLPCLNKKKNNFETFGKCIKDLKDSVNAKKERNLHYMCTDIINPIPKHSNLITHSEWRKFEDNMESENQTEIFSFTSNFLTDPEKKKSNIMNRIENMKELVNDLTAGKGEGKKRKSTFSTFEGNIGKSELDFVRINSLVCNEAEQSGETKKHIVSELSAQRKIYVSRASNRLISQDRCWKYQSKNSYKHLFECCLLVGLTLCESKENVPYVKSVFPPEKKPPPLIEFLCFPDASYWPPTSENNHPEEQCYSLVVTGQNGERKFGYCRRVLPEGGHVCLPLTYCIISPHRAGGFFYKVLEELESRHGSPGVENFIQQLYESQFPGPGERLKLKEILEEATRTNRFESDVYLSSTLLRRPPDIRLEEKDLTQLLQHLHLPIFLKVFGSLLLERKVLLLSNSLRKLSSCIEAFQLILLPFSWQHTYIPVLPLHLIEMCEAPTPYVIGLLKPRNIEKSLTNINFEDGILVDLDDSRIIKCCGDEGSILPSRFIKDLKTSLNLAMNVTDLSESVRSVLISDVFIRFFVQVCGNYSKFVQDLPSGEKIFQKNEFVTAASNTVQSFLDWFTETAMFNSFIQERLQGDDEGNFYFNLVPVITTPSPSFMLMRVDAILWAYESKAIHALIKLFRRRAMEYSEESIKDSAVLLKNYRGINKKVRTLGDKIKDFTSFTK